VSRLAFFLLAIAAITFGAHLWLASATERPDFSTREKNRDDVRIVAVTSPAVAERNAEETRRTVQSLAGAACVEFSGIAGNDIPRAREAFNALQLGERISERRVEEITRYWVYMPPARDRRSAEVSMAQLRRQGVNDMSIRPDNAISLGVFSSEEAARRFMTSLDAKGVKGAESGPFARETREIVMLIREPDTETVARLTVLQRDYPGAQLRAVTCPAA
jgi:hypothetical protein